jgi:hypothetical protein
MGMDPASRKVRYFDGIGYWAYGGAVCIYDERDGKLRMITPLVARERAEALAKEAERCVYPSERKKFIDVGNELTRVADEAAAQGDPTDEKVMAYYSRHHVSRPVQLVVPGIPDFNKPRPKLIIAKAGDKVPTKAGAR